MKPLCKVLVVEDDAYVRQLLGEVFRTEGYDLVLVDGGDAMRRVLDDDPAIDAVVIDVALPGAKDGLELAQEVAAEGYGVVLVTGNPTRYDDVRRSGHDHLFKPFRIAALLDLIDAVLTKTRRDCRRPQASDTART